MNNELIEMLELINNKENSNYKEKLSDEYCIQFTNKINEVRNITRKMGLICFISSNLFLTQVISKNNLVSFASSSLISIFFINFQGNKMFKNIHNQFTVKEKLKYIKNN